MALDMQTALSEYGAIAVFAQSNPDVSNVLQQAIAGEWDAARFQRELWKTNWYKSQSDQQRQLQVLQVTDPGTYKSTLDQKANQVLNLASQMGKTISADQARGTATVALQQGWSDSVLQAGIAEWYGNTSINGRLVGQAGDYENHIRSTYAAYGIPLSEGYLQYAVNEVMAGKLTTGGIDNQAIAAAQKLYPQYAQDFTEGRTLSQIAQPFMQHMSNVLEVDPSAIDLTDKTIMKALAGDGKNPTPLWAFDQQLKADPRWQKTTNAQNSAYDIVRQIGQDWGFTK